MTVAVHCDGIDPLGSSGLMMTSGRALCAKNRSVAAGSSGLMMTSGRALCAKNRSVAAGASSGLMMTNHHQPTVC